MKRILFVLFAGLMFINIVKADEWQEEKIEGENVITEYRYRYYFERKDGEYLVSDTEGKYEFVDDNNVKYGEYSEWTEDCSSDYDILYGSEDKYQTIAKINIIMLKNVSDKQMNIKSIKIYDNDTLINHNILGGINVNVNNNIINTGGLLIISLENPLEFINHNIHIDLDNRNLNYQLYLNKQRGMSDSDVIAIIDGKSSIKKYNKNSNYVMKPLNGDILTGYNIQNDKYHKVLSSEEVCKYREIKKFNYNIHRTYIDDEYYASIDDINVTDNLKSELKKDEDDYKIFYKVKLNNDNNSDNDKDHNNDKNNDNKNNNNNTKNNVINNDIINNNDTNELVKTGIEKENSYFSLYFLGLGLLGYFVKKFVY